MFRRNFELIEKNSIWQIVFGSTNGEEINLIISDWLMLLNLSCYFTP